MSNLVQPNYKGLLIQKTAYLFFGKAMPVIILFLITIIYSRKLTYDDYGIFQSVWMYANIVNVIISFGVSAVILSTNINFFFSFIKKYQREVISFYCILSILTLILFFVFSKNFNAAEKYSLTTFIIVQNLITVWETLLIKQGGERKAFVINIFYSLLFFGWHMYVLFENYVLSYLIAGIVFISILKFFAVALMPLRNRNDELLTDDKSFPKHWAYLGFNDILGIISKWIDKIFLLYLLPAADFAVFFNGSFEIPLFGILISVTGSFLLIEISGNTKAGNRITELFRENFNMLSSIVFPLFFSFYSFGNNFLF